MRVEQFMTKILVTASPDDHLDEVQRKMEEGRFRRVPIVEGGRLVGIVTDRDLRERVTRLPETYADAAMTTEILTIAPDAPLEESAEKMIEHQIGGLPVVRGDRLVGIVTTSDVLRAFCQVSREKANRSGPASEPHR